MQEEDRVGVLGGCESSAPHDSLALRSTWPTLLAVELLVGEYQYHTRSEPCVLRQSPSSSNHGSTECTA